MTARGDEVHGRLPQPVRWTIRTRPTLGNDGVDRLALARAEGRLRSGDRKQQLEGAISHVEGRYLGPPTRRPLREEMAYLSFAIHTFDVPTLR
jgi:hypothetical protein